MTIDQAQKLAEQNLTGDNGGIYDERKDVYVDTDNLAQSHDPKKRFGIKITNTIADQKRLVLHPGMLIGKRPVQVQHWVVGEEEPLEESYTYYLANDNVTKIKIKDYGTVEPPTSDYGYYIFVDDDIENLIDNGIVADGIARDGIAVKEGDDYLKIEPITGSTVAFFRDYVTENPTLIKRVVINSNVTSTYSNTIFEKPISPFEDTGERKVFLNDFFRESAERTEKITVDLKEPLQFDDEHVISMDIPGGSSENPVEITMEFLVGASERKGLGLARKHKIAQKRDEILKLN